MGCLYIPLKTQDPERLEESELVDDFKETVFSKYKRNIQTQRLYKSRHETYTNSSQVTQKSNLARKQLMIEN